MISKQKKAVSAIAAAVLTVGVLLTGTFAWQSISQTARNESDGVANPGGRLHDDFNGSDKNIYVENYTDPEDGSPIFARIRLYEYMEIGLGAGDASAADRAVQVIGKTDADIDDSTTWAIHTMNSDAAASHTAIHQYWHWTMGGSAVYMPTFNKNKDSLAADINGTYEGPDGDRTTPGDKYADYVAYILDETKTDTAYYDADDDTVDEGNGTGKGNGGTEGTNYTSREETHTATQTPEAAVLTMEEWKAMGSPVGKYWVYDTDGWAYWAEAIQPGEATGLLLDGIEPIMEPAEKWYYAIDVVGQFASSGDWGDADAQTGFYADGMTSDGLFLLNQAAGKLPKIERMTVRGGYKQYINAGNSLTLEVDMDILNATGSAAETYVLWSADPATAALSGNTFTPTSQMVGQIYRLTATSAYDGEKSTFVDVYVLPADAVGVVEGELDGKLYVDFGDNTYKELKDDGSLGEFVSAGKDMIIGNRDDNANVVVLDTPDANYGSKFIGPNLGDTYWAMGPDGKLGTEDDVKVIGQPWPNNLTTTLADGITISTVNGEETIKVGKKMQLSASVTLKGTEIANQDVTWTVSGNTSESTTIDANGLLTVGADEPLETILTIYAESQEMAGVKTYKNITVKPLDFEDSPSVTAGSTTTVTIDDVEWYVLVKDNGKALLLAKNTVYSSNFGSTNVWQDSTIRTTLNGTWLESTTVLKEKAVETEITTRSAYNATDWITTQDKVFLLSEADLFGTFNKTETSYAQDYTYGDEIIVPDVNMIKSTSVYWLRSPRYYSAGNPGVADVGTAGTVSSSTYNSSHGVRPALWVDYVS